MGVGVVFYRQEEAVDGGGQTGADEEGVAHRSLDAEKGNETDAESGTENQLGANRHSEGGGKLPCPPGPHAGDLDSQDDEAEGGASHADLLTQLQCSWREVQVQGPYREGEEHSVDERELEDAGQRLCRSLSPSSGYVHADGTGGHVAACEEQHDAAKGGFAPREEHHGDTVAPHIDTGHGERQGAAGRAVAAQPPGYERCERPRHQNKGKIPVDELHRLTGRERGAHQGTEHQNRHEEIQARIRQRLRGGLSEAAQQVAHAYGREQKDDLKGFHRPRMLSAEERKSATGRQRIFRLAALA